MDADLVLEGSGDRAIAIIGAVSVLEEAGYRFHRIAGTSAGAVVGALLAAGYTTTQLRELFSTRDSLRFMDRRRLRLSTRFCASRLLKRGLYRGSYAHAWLQDVLDEAGVRTFADLHDASGATPDRRTRLVVLTSDLTFGALRRLPWDYDRYGLDPDSQPVAEAVRASTAMPMYFDPVRLDDRIEGTKAVLVDGSVLSPFPIGIFDARDRPPRWPTLGVKLATSARSQTGFLHDPANALKIAELLAGATDRLHFSDPWVIARTIFVDTFGVPPVPIDLDHATLERLYEGGRAAAEAFLASFDMDRYVHRFLDAADSTEDLSTAGSDQPSPAKPLSVAGEAEQRQRIRAINPSLQAFYAGN